MSAEQQLPRRQPGAHLPRQYRVASAWPGQRGILPRLDWANSVPYELLARVRDSLPHA